MDDNIVDSLRVEIEGDSGKATDSIEKLISTLERIKNVTNGGNKALNTIQKNLDKLAECVNRIDSGSTAKLRDLAEGLKGLNDVGNIGTGKTAERIVELGEAVGSLKNVDFTPLTELASGLQALGNVGDINIPRFGGTTVPSPTAPNSPDVFDDYVPAPPPIDVPTGAPSELPETIENTRSLLRDFEVSCTRVFSRLSSVAAKGTSFVAKQFGKLAGAPLTLFGKSISTATSKVGEFFKMFKKRTMYRAINSVISAITTGFKEGTANVYQYSKALGGTLASSLDRIATSALYFKNSVGAMSAPLINMFAPAIDYIIDKCVDLLNALNRVFAKLSGASTWTKAVKYPTEYAQAANSATAANKELKKSILGIDELNLLTDNSSSNGGSVGGGMDYSQMFEEIPLVGEQNTFGGMIQAFAEAWARQGQSTVQSINGAFLGIQTLLTTVGESFRMAWSDGTGLQMVSTLLMIFQNVLGCVENLTLSLASAWKTNENGYIIAQNILSCFNSILQAINNIWEQTAGWIGALDFEPLMTSFGSLTTSIRNFVNLIMGGLQSAYTEILLPLAEWAIEEAVPKGVDMLSKALDTLTSVLRALKPYFNWLWDNIIVPLGKFAWSTLSHGIDLVTDAFTDLSGWAQGNNGKLRLSSAIILGLLAGIIGYKSMITVMGLITKVIGVFGTGAATAGIKAAFFVGAISILAGGIIYLANHWNDLNGLEKAITILGGLAAAASAAAIAIAIFHTAWSVGIAAAAIAGGLAVLGLTFAFTQSSSSDDAVSQAEQSANSFYDSYDFNKTLSLPQLAKGGVAKHSTVAMIAEGRYDEAVLPLSADVYARIGQGIRDAGETDDPPDNQEEIALLREQNSILRKILDKDTSPQFYGGAKSIISDIERKNRRDGRTVIPIGV